jgi:hypothetical protein
VPWILIPGSIAQHTVESLYAEHGPAQPWIYWLLLLVVAAALVALPLVKVDVTVRAPGVVRPTTERTELRVPIGAQIAQVLAHDNDTVVETLVSSKDVGLLKPGQPAHCRTTYRNQPDDILKPAKEPGIIRASLV